MSGALAAKVARLRAAFIAQLPERLETARTELHGLTGQWEDEAASRLRLVLHNLKGASATFGLTELNGVARAAEDLLTGHPEGGGGILAGITGHVETMTRIVAALGSGTEAPPAPVAAPAPRQDDSGGRTGGKRVYLCDDDSCVAEHLRSHLAEWGYEVTVFGTPRAARAAVAARMPDALIMDAVFTDGPSAGFDVVDDIRRGGGAVPTLFLSSRDDFAARLRAVQGGGAGYFTKPVRVQDLVERLDALTAAAPPAPLRVLVVDDEPAVAAYHGAILDEAGIEVRIVTEPGAVLDSLRDFPADLVLMDVHMPGCGGRDLAQVIRHIPDYLSLPIVFLSGEMDAQRQEAAMKAGGDGFLTKPIDPPQLVQAVVLRAERMRALRVLMAELRSARDSAEDALTRLQETQEALLQAEKLASLGALVQGVSHEINTPMGVVLSCASHLADATGRLTEAYRADDVAVDDFERFLTTADEASKLIVANSERALGLVTRFQQVAVNHHGLERRRFDLAAAIQGALFVLRPRIERGGHGVSIQCPPGGLTVEGYPGALGQVLTNFVTNSLVHGFDPGVSGTLSVTVEGLAEGLVRLVYHDDGKGIAEADLGRIFDPFFTTRRGSGGSGLGLHIVYNLVTGPMQGSINVASAAGEGTTFTVVFPLVAGGPK